ncbi:MAG: hypothetical protein AAF191_17190, partial [Verrucomicrobiota bacterium]
FKISPFAWRGWWHYGTGALGDTACHIMDMGYWAMELGSPDWVKGESNGGSEWSAPINSIIEYQFPANDYSGKDGIKYMWYDGYTKATFDRQKWALVKESNEYNHPSKKTLNGMSFEAFGSCVVGEKGTLYFNRSKDYWVVLPTSAVDGYTDWPKPSIARARDKDPHKEWYDAITGKVDQAESHFGQSGPFTEAILLGCLAQRAPGEKLEWDSENLEVKGRPEMQPWIKRDYRPGWELTV